MTVIVSPPLQGVHDLNCKIKKHKPLFLSRQTYKKICLRDARATLSRDFVPTRNIDDVDDVVRQLPAEICC